MLTTLSIKNYALIDEIQVDFGNGLSIITGETGAGKSIILGALSLILGKRADLTNVKDGSKKMVVEATFDIANYKLKSFFTQLDLDYDTNTIIRREILPSGKSRAFINDSPVNLDVLQELSNKLIDVHSQHENLKLSENQFQFQLIDALANNENLLSQYGQQLEALHQVETKLDELNELKAKALREQDYNLFLLDELQKADLVEGEQQSLEEEQQKLSHVDLIKEHLVHANQLLHANDFGLLDQLNSLKSTLSKISDLNASYLNLYERVNASLIELDDVAQEIENEQEQLNLDPSRLEAINSKLQLIHSLLLKHSVTSVDELIEIKYELENSVQAFETIDDDLVALENEKQSLRKSLDELALQIHDNRTTVIPELISTLSGTLSTLGMPNAQFRIDLNAVDVYHKNGKDELSLLFTANKGEGFKSLKKVASGGEMSRIMLSVKSILCRYKHLPTIIFDEVDAGVSGEISNKMADIMKQMSLNMQVISITHLPQIAAKGDSHYKVFKEDVNNETITNLVKLNSEERIVEIAEMLGGKETTASAVAHAKQLLN